MILGPEKYSAGHSCKGKHIFVIEVGEEDINEKSEDTVINLDSLGDTTEISIYIITGSLGCLTMKVERMVDNRRVTDTRSCSRNNSVHLRSWRR